jgi:hypothetical protein
MPKRNKLVRFTKKFYQIFHRRKNERRRLISLFLTQKKTEMEFAKILSYDNLKTILKVSEP